MPLNPCQIPDFVTRPILDPPVDACHPQRFNLNNVPFIDDINSTRNVGLGKSDACSPGQTGGIFPDPDDQDKYGKIIRYPKSLRGTDEAMKDLFSDIKVSATDGAIHKVPIIYGSQEKAVMAVIQTTVRQDNSLVVDRIRLPMMSIYASDYTFDETRYTWEEVRRVIPRRDLKPESTISEQFDRDTVLSFSRGIPYNIGYQLTIWTMYLEDMMQIQTQIMLKVPKMTYIKVQGVDWEVPVKITSVLNNLDTEPGDQALRIIKYQYVLTAETYIAQPIIRKPAALKITTDYADGEQNNIQEILFTETQAVEELEQC